MHTSVAERLNTLEVTNIATYLQDAIAVHRHVADPNCQHEHTATCWCSPLVLTHNQIVQIDLGDLMDMLADHFAVH